VNTPPNDVRHFVHKRIIGAVTSLIPAAASFIPGGSTALEIGRSILRGGGAAPAGTRLLPPPRRPLTPIVRTQPAPVVRAAPAAPRTFTAKGLRLTRDHLAHGHTFATPRHAFLTDARVRASGFRPPSVPPRNPIREANLHAKPFGEFARIRRPRARIPFIQPLQEPHPSGVRAMPRHKPILDALRRGFAPAADPCGPGEVNLAGKCIDPLAAVPGGAPFISDAGGTAVMGRYGAAYVPGSRIIDRAVCLPGDLVGDDGFCYNRKSLTNKERMWPRGRQPLLTGGEMRAISIASRAAGKFERTQKRLQKIGMLKKPAPRARRVAPAPHVHQITSGS